MRVGALVVVGAVAVSMSGMASALARTPVVAVVLTAHPVAVTATPSARGGATAVVPVKGKVTPAHAGRVVLQRKVARGWADVGRAALSGRSTFSVAARLPVGRALLRVVKATAVHSPAVASRSFVVTVKPPKAAPPSQPPAPLLVYPFGAVVPAPGSQNGPVQFSGGDEMGGYVGRAFGGWIGMHATTTGHGAPTFTVLSGLPDGLTLDPSTGKITGRATKQGSYSLEVRARVDGQNLQAMYPLVIVNPPVIDATALPHAVVGKPYRFQLREHGGFAPLTWTVANLPPGLHVSTSGLITGTPTAHADRGLVADLVDGGQNYEWNDNHGVDTRRPVDLIVGPLPVKHRTLVVPTNFPGIQAAINAADDGDTVLVRPGTYTGALNFHGKAITVTSTAGPAKTVIDGGDKGTSVQPTRTAVTFSTGESRRAVLRGFTIRHGYGAYGGGIRVVDSSPTIENNVITGNAAEIEGGGIDAWTGSPRIAHNTIIGNGMSPLVFGDFTGEAVDLYRTTAAQLVDNRIVNNFHPNDDSGGVAVSVTGAGTLLEGNVIGFDLEHSPSDNVSALYAGWDEFVTVHDPLIIINNVFDGQVTLDGPTEFVNNTAYGTDYAEGVVLTYEGSDAVLANNIMVAEWSGAGLDCQLEDPLDGDLIDRPVLRNNLVYNHPDPHSAPNPYDSCKGTFTAATGNRSGDPLFVDENFSDINPDPSLLLTPSSPAVDAGTAQVPGLPVLPTADITGHPRITDGDHNGSATIDIGAIELQ